MLKTLLTACLLVCSVASVAWAQRGNPALTQAQIKEAEQRLAELGYWTGRVDGVFDVGSRSALIAFQKWEGRTVNGRLSVDELEVLRSGEAPKPKDPGYEHVVWQATVKEMTPESLFSFTWHPYGVDPKVDYSKEEPTLVEFRLTPAGRGTLLVITESGFDHIPAHRRMEALRMNTMGWEAQTGNIAKHVSQGP